MNFNFLPLWLRVAVALIDYMIKAAANWKDTPEGSREWADFTTLYETSINNDANGNVEFGVEDTDFSRASAGDVRQPKTRIVNS